MEKKTFVKIVTIYLKKVKNAPKKVQIIMINFHQKIEKLFINQVKSYIKERAGWNKQKMFKIFRRYQINLQMSLMNRMICLILILVI